MKIGVERHEGCAVVKLRGSADMTEEEPLRTELEALAKEQLPLVVLDLAELDFIGSAALSAIVYGHLKSRHHQGQIRLACPQPAVLDVVRRTRLTSLFPVFDTLEQAMTP